MRKMTMLRRELTMIILIQVRIALLGLLTPGAAWALQTEQVDIGIAGTYDGTVKIVRDAQGRMLLSDHEVTTPTSLNELRSSGKDHGLLLGLSDDDHPQYVNTPRHDAAHSAANNAALATPADVAGNVTLGAHEQDSRIHLNRTLRETISGSWLFSGQPECQAGLKLSQGGSAGNSSILFKSGTTDAQLLWNESGNRFELNRNLNTNDLSLGTSGGGDRQLTINTSILSNYLYLRNNAGWCEYGANGPLRVISNGNITLLAGTNCNLEFCAGNLFNFTDRDGSGLSRVTIDSATGALNMGIGGNGGLSVNGTEVVNNARAATVTGLTSSGAVAGTNATFSGDLTVGSGGGKLLLNGQRLVNTVNLLDNPDFNIWQRNITQSCASGGSADGTQTWPVPGTLNTGADRWQISRSKTDMSSTVSRTMPPATLATTKYCLKNEFAGGSPNCIQYIHQTVSRELTCGLRGKWVTFAISHYLAGGASGSGMIGIYKTIGGVPTELARTNTTAPTNTWERLAVTALVPNDAETLLVCIGDTLTAAGPTAQYLANATLVEGKYVNGFEQTVSLGNASLPPVPKPPARDMMDCQQYFEKGSFYYTVHAANIQENSYYTSVAYNTAKASTSIITLSNVQTSPLLSTSTGTYEKPVYSPGQAWPQGFRFYASGTTSTGQIFNISGDWTAACPEPL